MTGLYAASRQVPHGTSEPPGLPARMDRPNRRGACNSQSELLSLRLQPEVPADFRELVACRLPFSLLLRAVMCLRPFAIGLPVQPNKAIPLNLRMQLCFCRTASTPGRMVGRSIPLNLRL